MQRQGSRAAPGRRSGRLSPLVPLPRAGALAPARVALRTDAPTGPWGALLARPHLRFAAGGLPCPIALVPTGSGPVVVGRRHRGTRLGATPPLAIVAPPRRSPDVEVPCRCACRPARSPAPRRDGCGGADRRWRSSARRGLGLPVVRGAEHRAASLVGVRLAAGRTPRRRPRGPRPAGRRRGGVVVGAAAGGPPARVARGHQLRPPNAALAGARLGRGRPGPGPGRHVALPDGLGNHTAGHTVQRS